VPQVLFSGKAFWFWFEVLVCAIHVPPVMTAIEFSSSFMGNEVFYRLETVGCAGNVLKGMNRCLIVCFEQSAGVDERASVRVHSTTLKPVRIPSRVSPLCRGSSCQLNWQTLNLIHIDVVFPLGTKCTLAHTTVYLLWRPIVDYILKGFPSKHNISALTHADFNSTFVVKVGHML